MTPSPKLAAVLRRLLLGTACVGTLLALFVVEENWRGDRAWTRCEKEIQAKGERLDLAAFRPAPVRDEQNFFKAPRLARMLYPPPGERRNPSWWGYVHTAKDFAALRDSRRKSGASSDPATVAAATKVLDAMRLLAPVLDEMREAARTRPREALEPYVMVVGGSGPVLEADMVLGLGLALATRASAEIELGRIDDAYADLFAAQRLANALAIDPDTLLNLLIGVALQKSATEVIAEGCERHLWSDSQLVDFQRSLDALRPLAGFSTGIRIERALAIYWTDMRMTGQSREMRWPWWMFHGWAQQNKVAVCRSLDEAILARLPVDLDRILPMPVASERAASGRRHRFYWPSEWLSRVVLSNLDKILDDLGREADRLRLASLACALERHHLVRGRYPETLDALVPEFIGAVPRGMFDGEPVRSIRLTAGAQIYFTGRNGRDDGGKEDDCTLTLPKI